MSLRKRAQRRQAVVRYNQAVVRYNRAAVRQKRAITRYNLAVAQRDLDNEAVGPSPEALALRPLGSELAEWILEVAELGRELEKPDVKATQDALSEALAGFDVTDVHDSPTRVQFVLALEQVGEALATLADLVRVPAVKQVVQRMVASADYDVTSRIIAAAETTSAAEWASLPGEPGISVEMYDDGLTISLPRPVA